jgi:3-deoxy-7-phosphoheptulonate synthase
MILLMNPGSTTEHVNGVVQLLDSVGLGSWVIDGASHKAIEVLGGNGDIDRAFLEKIPMVDRVFVQGYPVLAAGRQPGDRTAELPLGANAGVGGRRLCVIAGPCSVESRDQLLEIAVAVKESGAVGLRGGAFKPRTSPYSFQGHGERGLEWLALAREETGLAIVTEVMRCEHVDLVARYADALQVGSRNMHNTHLLAAAGRQGKSVLLKRGLGATLDELLQAAEYVMLEGNPNVILCERGIRTHETYVRNTLALAIVPELKRISRLPVIVDPSHGTGRDHLVTPMSNAAVACGADGLLIEVHHAPGQAWTDGAQSLDLEQFRLLMKRLKLFAEAADREI